MKLLVLVVAVFLCAAPALASDTSKQKKIHHQLKRYYHADGYIKAIGRVAYRTQYNPNPRISHRWQRAVRYLVGVRADAARKLYKLRHPYVAPRRLYSSGGMPGIDSCLDTLIRREGGYNPHAVNPSSGAYGAPQALPGSKMASAGADWRDNLATQIRWMIGYVNSTYGGSCNALSHSYAYGWY